MNNKNSTIKDVAKLANVSIKTVSRVINNEPTVKIDTQTKVEQAIAELNYTPNLAARTLKSSRSFTIALAYSNPSPNYIYNILNGCTTECQKHNFNLLMYPCDYKNNCIEILLLELVASSKADAIVLTPPLSDMSTIRNLLTRRNIIFATIAATDLATPMPTIYNYEFDGAYDLTNYLIGLGHTDIAFIKGHADHGGSEQRWLGFVQAMHQAKIKIKSNFIQQGDFAFNSGFECAKQLLRNKNPTAIFAANDDMAAGAVMYANKNNIKVPEQLSIAGFDNSPIASHIWPRLTTAHQHIEELVKTAIFQCVTKISGKNIPKFKAHTSEIIVRESTAKIND